MNIYQNKLEIEHLYQEFGDEKILKDISLNVREGQIVGIIGPSGVGKTTLFNIIAGIKKQSSGIVNIYADKISYMLQKDLLLPFRTAYENISLPLEIRKEKKIDIKKKIEKHVEEFGLNGLMNKYPKQLSGGQRQRVALLRTYMISNELVLLDEPFCALDYVTKSKMYEWFINLKNKLNLTCLLISHDIDEIMYLSDKIYVMLGKPASLKYCFDMPKDKKDILSKEMVEIKKKIHQVLLENN